MEISKKTFPLFYNAELSFLQLTNKVSFEDAEVILLDHNYFIFKLSDYEIRKYIKSKKIIYIDGTYELMSPGVLEKLNRFPKIKSICYFYNPRDKDNAHNQQLLLKLKQKGLVCVATQYFVDYANIYQPDINATIMPKKLYLCLTGKVNSSRTFLIALLSKYNLLQHGYVSYFGEDYSPPNFSSETIEQYRNAFFLSPLAKDLIRQELTRIKLPLVADTTHFSAKISHTKKFNAQLYSAVDFVIVPETFGCAINGEFFPTEKTIKCINLNKKFIPIASKDFLKNLKKYYKDNFNKDISHLTDWCDTSFDNLPSLEERIKRVLEVVMNEISNYNKNNLKESK